MSAREEILGRVRRALAGVEADPTPVVPPRGARPADAIGHFLERVADYRAEVARVYADGLAAAVAAALPPGGRVVVPPGLPADVRAGIAAPVEDAGLTAHELDEIDAVVTCCRLAIAETGTLVLDHEPDQGRRALTLVPDRHVCVVRADQIVPDVPEAMALLDPSRPLTWISGPSATSDIELERVEGVHGPRHLHVIVVSRFGQSVAPSSDVVHTQ